MCAQQCDVLLIGPLRPGQQRRCTNQCTLDISHRWESFHRCAVHRLVPQPAPPLQETNVVLTTLPLQSPAFVGSHVDLGELDRLNRKVLILQKTIYSMHRIGVEQSGAWSPQSAMTAKEDKQPGCLVKRVHKKYMTKRS